MRLICQRIVQFSIIYIMRQTTISGRSSRGQVDLEKRQHSARYGIGGSLTDARRTVALIKTRCEWIGQDRQPPGTSPPCLGDSVAEQPAPDPRANSSRLDEKLVQIERMWPVARPERD